MKDKKIKLSELKVKSFITPLEQKEQKTALGGRASEEIIFEKISTGALNDLEK